MISKKQLPLYWFALLFLLLSMRQGFSLESKQQSESIPMLLNSINLDLQTLKISIDSYKMKTAELTNLIDLSLIDLQTSQADLKKQKDLLSDSMDKLKQMEIRYSELLTTFNALNVRYQSSIASNKIKTYAIVGLLGACIVEGIVIYISGTR